MESLNLESGMAKFYELQTELERTIENIEKLKKQYDALNEIVEASGRKEELPDNFIEGLNEYKENLNQQSKTIMTRLAYVKILIGMHEKQDDNAKVVDQIISLAFAALGLTGNEKKEESKEAE